MLLKDSGGWNHNIWDTVLSCDSFSLPNCNSTNPTAYKRNEAVTPRSAQAQGMEGRENTSRKELGSTEAEFAALAFKGIFPIGRTSVKTLGYAFKQKQKFICLSLYFSYKDFFNFEFLFWGGRRRVGSSTVLTRKEESTHWAIKAFWNLNCRPLLWQQVLFQRLVSSPSSHGCTQSLDSCYRLALTLFCCLPVSSHPAPMGWRRCVKSEVLSWDKRRKEWVLWEAKEQAQGQE